MVNSVTTISEYGSVDGSEYTSSFLEVPKQTVIHPDVLAAHAQFGGDLLSMQAMYDRPIHLAKIKSLEQEIEELKNQITSNKTI